MKKAILIRLDESIYEALKEQDENINSLVRSLLREYIATKKLQEDSR